MRTFKLVRKEDKSGVSGCGIVGEGVEFHDFQAVLSWFGNFHTITVFPRVEDITKIHGHAGSTEVVFDDEAKIKL